MTALGKLPPFDKTMEESIVGAVLADVDVLPAVRERLRPEHFFLEKLGLIYAAALAVAAAGKPVTPVLVAHELGTRGQLERIGGLAYLSLLTTELPTSVGAEWYAAQVIEDATKRRLIAAGGRIAGAAYRNGQSAEALGEQAAVELQQALAGLGARAPAGPALTTAPELLRQQFPPVRTVVEGLLAEGAIILAGRPKLGKSWLGLGCALAVAAGGIALGQRQVTAGDVLWLPLEDGERRAQRRIAGMLAGEPAPARLSIGFAWRRLDEGGLEDIAAWCEQHPEARLVVIDTLKRVRPEEQGHKRLYDLDYDALAPIADLAKRLGVCILVVHHTRKGDAEDVLDLISGSTGLTGSVDGAIVLKRVRGERDAELSIIHRDLDDQAWGLRFEETPLGWQLTGTADDARRSVEQRAVLRLLAEAASTGPLSSRELGQELGRPAPTIRRLLGALKHAGLVDSSDRGYWITSKGETSLAGRVRDQGDHPEHGDHTRSRDQPITPDQADRVVRPDQVDRGDRPDRVFNEAPVYVPEPLCPAGCGVRLRDAWCPVCGGTFQEESP